MKIKKRKCRLCKKEIEVYNHCIGGRGHGSGKSPFVIALSDQAVFFQCTESNYSTKVNYCKGVWFCNDCWKKVNPQSI